MIENDKTPWDINCRCVSKRYGSVQALSSVSFSVRKGELFGLIGPDGAGKTTLFRILSTLMLADEGSAEVNGLHVVKDYVEIRKRIGYMPGRFSLYQDLSVEENLNFFAALFATTVEENYDLIRDIYVQIEPFRKRRAGKLSGGMKQKLALCCALIHRPVVLLLDEPTTGVDVVSRREFWDMLKRLKEQNISILVSTPYMDEARLCDRIALMQSGRILSVETPQHIIEKYSDKLYALRTADMARLICDVQQMDCVESCFAFGEYLHLTFSDDDQAACLVLLDYLKKKGHQDVVCHPIVPSIEDCFIKLMR